ncbi:hypothetical protein KBZ08_05585 [Cyanobium sp. Candia 9D4]|uniref:hypothetical protein n=1 Tax=Cyanobium sp. Candia 9D4 TaxID=2823707 RepID=UPI0020CF439C|nr:hypothetical protein [Cyanobium sp. Candia 9D4]MCP9933381.1 hypothetical protein [Cyanobium sp. Candia 9D4]
MDWDKNLPSILAWGGAIVTGFFAVLSASLASRASTKQLSLKLRHENERDRLEARRERLEELYSLVTRWAKEMLNFFLPFMSVMKGDLTYNQALDMSAANRISLESDRLFTLAELYFHSGHDRLLDVRSRADEVSRINSDFKQLYKTGVTESPEHLKQMSDALTRFDNAINAYKIVLRGYASDL